VKFDFEDGSGERLYSIGKDPSGHTIKIDRNSNMFSMARNPSMLLAMIWEEAKILMQEPGKYDEFVRARNESWEKFMIGVHKAPASVKAPQKLKNLHLSNMLVPVQSVLASRFNLPYQFTALCVLEPYLHNAQKNKYYTILAKKHTGRLMHSLLVSEIGDELTVLYNPTREQLKILPSLDLDTAFVIIREYSSIQSSIIASYEKAVLDLYYEHKRGVPIWLDELEIMVNTLRNLRLLSIEKLGRMARHKNLDANFYKDE